LNNYLNFPHVGQAFAIERESICNKTGKISREIAYGIIRPIPKKYSPPTGAIGPSKTVAITFLTGILMRIEAESAKAMALKTSRAFDDFPSAL